MEQFIHISFVQLKNDFEEGRALNLNKWPLQNINELKFSSL